MELRESARRAFHERATLSERDTLRPYPLPPAASAALVSALRENEVRAAWLVQKRLRDPEAAPAVILAVDPGVSWYRPSTWSRTQELCTRLQLVVHPPEPLDAIVVVERGSALRRRLRGLAGAEVFRREGPPARAAASPEWAPPSRIPLVDLPRVPVVAMLLMMAAGIFATAIVPRAAEDPVPRLRAAAREAPADPEIARALAWALVDEGRWVEARPVLAEAVRLNPDDADLRNSLGWALMQEGELAKSVPVLLEALRLDPGHRRARHNLGWALAGLERYAEAEPVYREVIRRDPLRANAHSELGMVLLHLGRLPESERELRESVRLDGSDAWAHRVLGRVQKTRGDLPGAVASYRAAGRLEPRDAGTWAEIGHLEHLLGRFPESSTAFENARRQNPTYFQGDSYRRAIWEASKAGRMYVPPGS
jgi:tetratricopeptide (TPR) repeat protein